MSDYDAAFFDYVSATARHSAELIVPMLYSVLRPKSVLDVGCGQGAWLAVWQSQGAQVFGIDGDYVDRSRLEVPQESFAAIDLQRGFDLDRQFDLVQCLEVAEHVPPESTQLLIDNLTAHGSAVLFSAAPPGQGGHDHVNERSYDFWRAEFARREFVALDYLRPRILTDLRIAPWYRYNPMLYVRGDILAGLAEPLRASRIPADKSVPDVAPLLYRIRKRAVRLLPVWAMTAIARVKERLIGRKHLKMTANS